MTDTTSVAAAPLRLLYLEDNPLIVFHVEQMIEDLGHVCVGALDSFCELQKQFSSLEFDCALIDIDLADGPIGPEAAAWLNQRGILSIFVTGQEQVATAHSDVSIGTVSKPVSPTELADKIELLRKLSGR